MSWEAEGIADIHWTSAGKGVLPELADLPICGRPQEDLALPMPHVVVDSMQQITSEQANRGYEEASHLCLVMLFPLVGSMPTLRWLLQIPSLGRFQQDPSRQPNEQQPDHLSCQNHSM